MQLVPFVCAFYAFESPLFYNHHNHESDVTVVPFNMEIHWGDFFKKGTICISTF
jgi:hypothetical protein